MPQKAIEPHIRAAARDLWDSTDTPASQIAGQLGITKNAVIGMAWRGRWRVRGTKAIPARVLLECRELWESGLVTNAEIARTLGISHDRPAAWARRHGWQRIREMTDDEYLVWWGQQDPEPDVEPESTTTSRLAALNAELTRVLATTVGVGRIAASERRTAA